MGIRKARGWIDWRHRVLPAPTLSLSLILSSLLTITILLYLLLNYDIITFYSNIYSLCFNMLTFNMLMY